MKSRHLIAGFSLFLVLGAAVPAVAGTARPRAGKAGAARTRAIAMQALSITQSAHELAETAHGAAVAAQRQVAAAQAEAGAAQRTAERAGAVADAAQSQAGTSGEAAGSAMANSSAVEGTVSGALATGQAALGSAEADFSHIGVESHGFLGGPLLTAVPGVVCRGPQIRAVSGGFEITVTPAEPHINKPRDKEWVFLAQSAGDEFKMNLFAICLSP